MVSLSIILYYFIQFNFYSIIKNIQQKFICIVCSPIYYIIETKNKYNKTKKENLIRDTYKFRY